MEYMKKSQKQPHNNVSIIEDIVQSNIYLINNQKVMLDSDLAVLYEVETKILNQSVKRNIDRFPSDFMFRLDKDDEEVLSSQIVTIKRTRKWAIFAFTEQGIAMLSSVLRSDRAIQVNIQIMRTFTKLRQMLSTHKELREKIEALEKKYDGQFKAIFNAIHRLVEEEAKPKPLIGFRTE